MRITLIDWCKENNKEYLLKEYDFDKNTTDISNLTYASNKKTFWKCSKGHNFETKVANRTLLNRGCPYCSNQKLLEGYNDFATIHPELLEEWDYEKNGDLKPNQVMSGSKTKVWWKCKYGHSYQADLNHKTSTNATGCPRCFDGRQTSFAEQAFFYYIKKEFPDAISRYKNVFGSKFELDIYIPSIKTAIEYDGEAWHKNNTLEREQKKYELCHANNIKLIRMREKGYALGSNICDEAFVYENLYKYDVLQYAIYELIKKLTFKMYIQMSIDINIERDKNAIRDNMLSIQKESLDDKYPEIAKEWHLTKNGNLKPNMVKPRSDIKVWWLCSVCGFEYESTVGHRTYGTGCPKCGIKKSTRAKEKAVLMIDLKTNEVVNRFVSISEASRQTGISSGDICMVLKGKRPHTKGYSWKYKEGE